MDRFRLLFPLHLRSNLLCMLHLRPLPGAPTANIDPGQIADRACKEADEFLRVMGDDAVDGFLVENMADLPYVRAADMGPETAACMAAVCQRVRMRVPSHLPVGVQVLAGANREALAVARAADLQFVRAEGFVFGHLADEGYMDACAGPLLRYRRQIGAEDVAVFCDIKKKHSAHAVTADVDVAETADAARFFGADGVILTGAATGKEADVGELESVLDRVGDDVPVIVGSGITDANLADFARAHGLVVGSFFKKEGKWQNGLDPERMERMKRALLQLRSTRQ